MFAEDDVDTIAQCKSFNCLIGNMHTVTSRKETINCVVFFVKCETFRKINEI